jgi:hypothetical protein
MLVDALRGTEAAIQAHVNAIQDCNQRGGRMLSLVDLIEAGTVDLPLAAYLAAAMRCGASLLVGARPGGAGKTAVMGALLNFLPDHTVLRAVDSWSALPEPARTSWGGNNQPSRSPGALPDPQPLNGRGRRPHPRLQARQAEQICYLAHEISDAPYYAYVWGAQLRAFFRLAAQGHMIASNLHADTPKETRDQICRANGVSPAHLNAVTLKIYLQVQRSGWYVQRWISRVYESDGEQDRLLWVGDKVQAFARQKTTQSVIVSPKHEKQYAQFLTVLLKQDIRRIEDVRRALVDH